MEMSVDSSELKDAYLSPVLKDQAQDEVLVRWSRSFGHLVAHVDANVRTSTLPFLRFAHIKCATPSEQPLGHALPVAQRNFNGRSPYCSSGFLSATAIRNEVAVVPPVPAKF